MIATLNCATGTLAPYTPSAEMPWDKKRAQHLLRRMGYGIALEDIGNALANPPGAVVDFLIDQALNLAPPDEPDWANWNTADYEDFGVESFQQMFEWNTIWLQRMMAHGFREKLALFWHNHFVTDFESYSCPSYMYQYTSLLREHALGNFKAFTEAIGKTPAMLVYLNGVQNNRFSPNENYARELYELFTLGLDNGYTQMDITETARALTGWNGFNGPPFCVPIDYVPFLHDPGNKTIFGQTGPWNYEDVHNILFTQRADEIATHICTKIYRAFVHPVPDEAIVAGLAQTFKDSDFELMPVFRQLFKSEHFFDAYNMHTLIKSPIELFLTFLKEGGQPYTEQMLQFAGFLSGDLGQRLLSPIDVKGWPGDRTWIDTSSLTGRWRSMDYYVFQYFQQAPQQLVQLAKDLSNNAIDPYEVTQALIDHLVPSGLSDLDAYEQATTVFKWEVPQNYFETGEWNLDWDTAPIQLAFLLQHITRMPEFQLL